MHLLLGTCYNNILCNNYIYNCRGRWVHRIKYYLDKRSYFLVSVNTVYFPGSFQEHLLHLVPIGKQITGLLFIVMSMVENSHTYYALHKNRGGEKSQISLEVVARVAITLNKGARKNRHNKCPCIQIFWFSLSAQNYCFMALIWFTIFLKKNPIKVWINKPFGLTHKGFLQSPPKKRLLLRNPCLIPPIFIPNQKRLVQIFSLTSSLAWFVNTSNPQNQWHGQFLSTSWRQLLH